MLSLRFIRLHPIIALNEEVSMKIKPFLVHTNIPDRLQHLRELAMNLWFSWNTEALDLLIRLGYKPSQTSKIDYWEESDQNPVKMLGLLPQKEFIEACNDESFLSNLDRVYSRYQEYLTRKAWFARNYPGDKDFLVAYFSCEYGLDECLPVYSGGLGILSGDHLKSSSDLGIPLVGIGLLYQEGYFQQYLNNDGFQQERYPTNDWYNMPVTQETDANGRPIQISVELEDEDVYVRVWRVQVGRTPLYLLDTNFPENDPEYRKITSRLYGGDREMRIRQEIVLGIGGVRALDALGVTPTVFHINEGHSAFLAIERIRQLMDAHDITFPEAWEIVWASNAFTTHTPVPAGNETFSIDLIQKYFTTYAKEIGMTLDQFIEFGQEKPGKSTVFSMTVLALRMSAFCNGVSKLHGDTSRRMWQFLWPDLPLDEVPITSITNGIHTMSWISNGMRDLFERYIGPQFREEPENVALWDRVDNIPDNELWRVHQIRRERLIAFTRKRLVRQLRRRGASPGEVRPAEEVLDPHALTIGFSRRFASYKRASLLFTDLDRLAAILNHTDHPVQIIFAGKAHPQDNPGKELIRQIIKVANMPQFRDRVVFIENYDICVARYLIQGTDIWLNTPRRPLEASGTSGMKAALNGALNVSILDGWWVEGNGELNGWAIGSGEEYRDAEIQDEIESEALYRLLENDIIPTFYERDRAGLPRQWIRMMKSSIKNLGSYFNTHRMLIDYTQSSYINASHAHAALLSEQCKAARELAQWRDRITRAWSQVAIGNGTLDRETDIKSGDQVGISARVWLGFLSPQDVSVEVYFGRLDSDDQFIDGEIIPMQPAGQSDGAVLYRGLINVRFHGRCGYAIRVLPKHPNLVHPYTPSLIRWEK